jgi:hypothetical protein
LAAPLLLFGSLACEDDHREKYSQGHPISVYGVVGQVWVLGGVDMFLYLNYPDALDIDD